RLFYIQVIDDSYQLSADNQSHRYVTQYPSRGLLYDRHGALLIYNEAAYDLMVIPRDVQAMDTAGFCALLGIDRASFDERLSKARSFSRRKASVFEKQISADAFASISEKLYKYPGFFGRKTSLRRYPAPIGAHVLGYLSEVSPEVVRQDTYYENGDYHGTRGLERSYEPILRGERGMKVLTVDVHNVIKGSFQDGALDKPAVPGTDLVTTLDATLQAYGEQLMVNKKGSIVAIEPHSGEILALVSAPAYDPNRLVGRDRNTEYRHLVNNDSLDPLFNRALMAEYPPGSIFKMVQALIGMQEGVLNEHTGFSCNKSLVGCHNHPAASTLERGIQYSCNPYFYHAFKRIVNQGKSPSIFKDTELGLAPWKEHMLSFGLGQRLDLDLPHLKKGQIPGVDLYDNIYGQGRWAFSTIYSISIGQGEVAVIPLQMANLAAIIANRGHYYTPHLVKSIGQDGEKPERYREKHLTTVDRNHYDIVVNAMQRVVESPGGTARRARIDSVAVCGKTGTAENPHGEDHSVFIAFAPKDDPKIAMAVYVENAGFGGTWAAPIASLMMEKYLTGTIKHPEKEQRILEADFLQPVDEDAD
ncbi:MAG: penicillin-binding transpeptidase domain-containing protein, partial [Bacteroidota bacterium]